MTDRTYNGSATEDARRIAWRLPPAIITLSFAIFIAAIVAGLGADLFAPYGYNDQDLMSRLQAPSFRFGPNSHFLGTDELGRDVFSRLLYSLRISMIVAGLGTVIGAIIGSLFGCVTAHFRGLVDHGLSALIDFQAAMPFMIFALSGLAFFGNSLSLFVILLGLYGWESYARLARGLVLTAKGQGYFEAMHSLGFHPLRIYGRHVIPNIAGPLLVQVTLSFPGIILMESGLSFLGLGVQPPLTSLGLMIKTGRDYLTTCWWLAVCPGLTIFLVALAISLIGDWLRDRLDGSVAGHT